jgi:urease accessory protein
MHRVTAIKPAGPWDAATAKDRVVLDAEDRRRRRVALTGEKGTQFLLDFEKPVSLRDGDAVVLDDGSLVQVIGAPEPLVEVTAQSPRALARLAWHLGNRHTEAQIVGECLRIRRDHVLEDMLRGLGATLTPLEAPFDPESGAHDTHGHNAHGHSAHGHSEHGHGHTHHHHGQGHEA